MTRRNTLRSFECGRVGDARFYTFSILNTNRKQQALPRELRADEIWSQRILAVQFPRAGARKGAARAGDHRKSGWPSGDPQGLIMDRELPDDDYVQLGLIPNPGAPPAHLSTSQAHSLPSARSSRARTW